MFFLRYVFVSVLLLFWNAVAVVVALRRRRQLPGTLVWLGPAVLVLQLLELGLLSQVLGQTPEKPFYNYFWLFVLLLAAATIQNLLILKQGSWKRSGAYLLLGYNGLICLCALLFGLSIQPGLSLPIFLQGVVRSYIRLQAVFLCFLAEFLPSFHFFPLLALPPKEQPSEDAVEARQPGCLNRFARGVPVVYSALVVLVFLLALPDSIKEVRRYQQDLAGSVTIRPGMHFAVKVQCDLEGPFTQRLKWYQYELDGAEELGVDHLMHYLPLEFMESEERISEFNTMVELARRRGFKIMMAFTSAADWFFRSASDITDEEYDRRVKQACIVAAQRIHPSHLNPIVEPFGAQKLLGKRTRSPEQWLTLLNNIAAQVHTIDPQIRVGTNLCDVREPESETLFQLLCDPASPVDAPGMSINTGIGSLEEILPVYSRWLTWLPPEKEAWIYEFGITPMSYGQQAQARYIRRVADWAAREPRLTGISYYPLNDFAEPMGLIAFGRDKRLGFDAYRRIIFDSQSDSVSK